MTQAVADPPPRYRIPSTIQSYPQWRTVRRSGAQVRLPERNVRIIWLEDKLHVWKDPQHRLWWMRCDRCLVSRTRRLRRLAGLALRANRRA